MKVKDITGIFEQFAPLLLQEAYDNSGLCIGNKENDVKAILLTLDITEEVINEAIENDCNLIVSHHPLIFSGLKSITGKNMVERCTIKAIQNNINIFSAHTNADSVTEGVSKMICNKLNLGNCRILSPFKSMLQKLVVFVPIEFANKVREAILNAGAGNIGNYDFCSFNASGIGTFRANENAKPFVGKPNEIHEENETRIETIFPKYLQSRIIKALKESHPYEEPAYDIYPLENTLNDAGLGMVGELSVPQEEMQFLKLIEETFKANGIRYTKLRNKHVKTVAVCGGSGSSLLNEAINSGADFFITADFKYHQFFDAEGKIVIADIGHYESEQFTKEIFYHLLIKKFPNFAVHFSKLNTNPINYL
jgi:dinuclear metal center YbgI/SA1388 family protein